MVPTGKASPGLWLLVTVGVITVFSSLCAITGGLVAAKRHAYICLSPIVQPFDSLDDLGNAFIIDTQHSYIVIAISPGTTMFLSPYLVVFASALVGILLASSGAVILFGNRIAEYLDLPGNARKSSARNERLSSRAKTRYIDLS